MVTKASKQAVSTVSEVPAQPPAPVISFSAIEEALVQGNIAGLSSEQRVAYVNKLCDMLGLNPLTKPFEYMSLNGKLVLYATKGCAEQLRHIYKVSLNITAREQKGDVYVVTARSRTADGREDESTGAVATKGLFGESLANAYMKAETKAKRRVTLSHCGLNMLDETEAATLMDHGPPPARQAPGPVLDVTPLEASPAPAKASVTIPPRPSAPAPRRPTGRAAASGDRDLDDEAVRLKTEKGQVLIALWQLALSHFKTDEKTMIWIQKTTGKDNAQETTIEELRDAHARMVQLIDDEMLAAAQPDPDSFEAWAGGALPPGPGAVMAALQPKEERPSSPSVQKPLNAQAQGELSINAPHLVK